LSENTKFKLLIAVDLILFFALWIPYILIFKGLRGGGELFYLFPAGLAALLPVATVVLIAQYAVRKIRGSSHEAEDATVGCGWITVVIGLFGIMLIFVVTNDI
jgi:hypothetical protein